MCHPGQWVDGCKLPDGSPPLKYKINGFSSMLLSYAALGAAEYHGLIRLAWLHDHQLELATASIIFSAGLSIYLYVKAVGDPKTLKAAPGNTGILQYDFFMGHELNPRIGDFDLKASHHPTDGQPSGHMTPDQPIFPSDASPCPWRTRCFSSYGPV